MEVSGFQGFLRPRKLDGSWADPYLVVRGTWPDFMYEGDIWTYSLYAPQDMQRLIEMAGGERQFNARLLVIFSRGHFDIANEPGFLMPLLYNYTGPSGQERRYCAPAAGESLQRYSCRHPRQ
jgi:putative alpha-1,2-mannosidase